MGGGGGFCGGLENPGARWKGHVPLYEGHGHTYETLSKQLTATLEHYGATVTMVDGRGMEPLPLPELRAVDYGSATEAEGRHIIFRHFDIR